MLGKRTIRAITAMDVVIVLLLVAGPVWYFRHIARQREAISWIDLPDGECRVDPAAPEWLNDTLEAVDLKPITEITGVRLVMFAVTDWQLADLSNLTHLEYLN